MEQTNWKIFSNFETSPYSLEERGIEVDNFTKSLGLVTIAFSDKGATRIKVTAKSVGHKKKEELLQTSFVLDVYDFIVSSKMHVEDVIVK